MNEKFNFSDYKLMKRLIQCLRQYSQYSEDEKNEFWDIAKDYTNYKDYKILREFLENNI